VDDEWIAPAPGFSELGLLLRASSRSAQRKRTFKVLEDDHRWLQKREVIRRMFILNCGRGTLRLRDRNDDNRPARAAVSST
jgi:hypothetical protein